MKELNLEMGARRGFPYLSFQKVLEISSKIIFINVSHVWNSWHKIILAHLKKILASFQRKNKSPSRVFDLFFHVKTFYLVIYQSPDEVFKDIQENR